MVAIEVFDPPMCCTTGVCGPDPDSRLAVLAADLKWLESLGVQVRRFNLSQEPTAFTENPLVKQILDDTDGDGLPVILVDGRVVSQGAYPSRAQLADWAEVNEGLSIEAELSAARETKLIFDEQIAELVALGVSVAVNCVPCFEFHHRKAVKMGIQPEDMIQAVNVALQVKEQPAKMVMQVAQRLLVPEATEGQSSCCGDGKSGGDCC